MQAFWRRRAKKLPFRLTNCPAVHYNKRKVVLPPSWTGGTEKRRGVLIILGLDPGFGTMGYGVIEKDARGNCRAVDYGVVKTPAAENFAVRLCMLEEGVNALFDKFSPEEAAMEELFFSKNVTTGIAVAHARGVILLTCCKRCGRIFEYTPNQIKQALTGYGRADKGQMQRCVASHLRLSAVPRPDDAADALGVALCHAFTSRFSGMFGVR